jgi:hypothetical protein
MKTMSRAVALSLSLVLLPVVVLATDEVPQPVQPTEEAPTWVPPPPTQVDATTGLEVEVQQAAPAGQWVYTSQYGWVWMPHGNGYTNVPAGGAVPNMYVYYPAVGWSWVVAPWVWGWGAMPWVGYAGWGGYPWYGYGYGTWYGYARPYAYASWYGGRYWRGGSWHGVGPGYPAPPPPRSRYGAPLRSGGAIPAGPRPGGASPSRSGHGAPPRAGSESPYRTSAGPVGAPSSYATGRGYHPPAPAFAAGVQSFAPRNHAPASPGGGYGGGAPAGHAGGHGGGSGGGGHGGGRR